jgi:predicted dehydrogenase
MTFDQPYGHTPLEKAFGGDVYGVGYDAARAGRRPVRLGVVGAGGVAQSKYFPAVARLRMIWEPIQIAAFAEVRRDHAEKIQAIYGGTAYPNIESMLRNESLDGVLVLSPDALHAEHAHACIARGLAVLVEKPITRSLADAVALCRAADAAGVPLLTVANKRFSPPYQRAKRLLVAHFAQVIRGVEAPLVTGWDGCRAFEVLRAVQMAIRFGAWIDLPLDAEAADMAAERQ